MIYGAVTHAPATQLAEDIGAPARRPGPPADGGLGRGWRARLLRDALGKPVVVLARTIKGKGFSEIEDKNGWHGRPLPGRGEPPPVDHLGGQDQAAPPSCTRPTPWPPLP